MITVVVPRPMVRVGTEGRCVDAVVGFVDDGDCFTSFDGCSNHAACRMVKNVIITKAILYFLLIGKASESVDLALQVLFVVCLEQFIVSVCGWLVENVLCVGVGSDCMEFWFGRGCLWFSARSGSLISHAIFSDLRSRNRFGWCTTVYQLPGTGARCSKK